MWRQMNSMMLQKQYSPSQWSPNRSAEDVISSHLKTVNDGSKNARNMYAIGGRNILYGSSENQRLDIFAPEDNFEGAPIFVFIHGGYWQMMSRLESHYVAPSIVDAGAVAIVVGYDLAPAVNLEEIVSQIKRALHFIVSLATRHNASGIYICGHSAGAHLACMLMNYDWMKAFMRSSIILKGLILVSGVYDLQPMVYTQENVALKLTEDKAKELSPQFLVNNFHSDFENTSICIVIGQHDSPEFHRQSKEFYQALLEKNMNVQYNQIPDTDHFTIIESLQDKESQLIKIIYESMMINSCDV